MGHVHFPVVSIVFPVSPNFSATYLDIMPANLSKSSGRYLPIDKKRNFYQNLYLTFHSWSPTLLCSSKNTSVAILIILSKMVPRITDTINTTAITNIYRPTAFILAINPHCAI